MKPHCDNPEATKHSAGLELIGHVLAAAALLLKGYDKIGHGHLAIGAALMLAGALLVAFFVYVLRTGRGHRAASALVCLFEALAMALVSWLYFEEGTRLIQYATLLAAAMYLFAFIRILIATKRRGISLDDATGGGG